MLILITTYLLSIVLVSYFVYMISKDTNDYSHGLLFIFMAFTPIVNSVIGIILSIILLYIKVEEHSAVVQSILEKIFKRN